MTNEQEKARELAKLLTAFADGKQLQCSLSNTYNSDIWDDDLNALLSDIQSGWNFRIKPETKRVEYNLDDDLVGMVVIEKNKSSIVKRMIISQNRISVLVSDYQNYTDKAWYNYKQLAELFTFLDKSPCYKEVECE